MVSQYWWRNFFAFFQESHFQRDSDVATIPNPLSEVAVHVSFKMAQIGSLVGLGVVAPFYRHFAGRRMEATTGRPLRPGHLRLIGNRSLWLAGYTMVVIGLALTGPATTYVYCRLVRRYSDVELWDRCYRLRFNEKQLLMDRCTALFALLGFSWRFLPGAVGLTACVLVGCGLYNRLLFDRLTLFKHWRKPMADYWRWRETGLPAGLPFRGGLSATDTDKLGTAFGQTEPTSAATLPLSLTTDLPD